MKTQDYIQGYDDGLNRLFRYKNRPKTMNIAQYMEYCEGNFEAQRKQVKREVKVENKWRFFDGFEEVNVN